ncbi:MAG: hypothetical protein ACOX3W_08195 [Christensenellaceae bacterium]
MTETSATVTIGVAAFNITSSSTQMVDYGVSSTFDVTTKRRLMLRSRFQEQFRQVLR